MGHFLQFLWDDNMQICQWMGNSILHLLGSNLTSIVLLEAEIMFKIQAPSQYNLGSILWQKTTTTKNTNRVDVQCRSQQGEGMWLLGLVKCDRLHVTSDTNSFSSPLVYFYQLQFVFITVLLSANVERIIVSRMCN